ncbi:MAG: prepilin-type N-terminal cleavage/methylation domain-containing protein [Gemmataceae bacterium]
MMIHRRQRTGFTLLEVLLASTIALLLLGALYVSFDVVIAQSDIGREEIDKNDLARAVVNRLQIDIQQTTGPLPPKSGGESEAAIAAAANTGQTDSSGTSGTSGSSTSTATPTTTESGAADASGASIANTGGSIPFGAGLVGNSSTLTMFISRVPQVMANPDATSVNSQGASDLVRITYYRGSNGGLCRQERAWVTADGIWNSVDADRSDESGDLVAEEITEVQFQYFDGPSQSWIDSWDGTQLATDGNSLIGPPRAIKITLTIERPNTPVRRFAHVFPIRAANGLIIVQPPSTSSTTGSGSTSGGTSP